MDTARELFVRRFRNDTERPESYSTFYNDCKAEGTSLMGSPEPSHEELELLFVNNEKLDRLGAYLNRFNPIRTMRIEGMEIRHSAILAWLLDPSETHGFGDRFLKAFLSEALRGQNGNGSPTALDVSQADLRDAEVRREWQNIDIFVLSPRNNWVFIIENKFHASQHEGQLGKYAQKVEAAFRLQDKPPQVRGIFLTLLDEEPQDQSYAPIRYGAICELLPRLMALEGLTLGQEVTIFLKHYLAIIEDATGMSEERKAMEELARQLYRQHRKVLDFVLEHGSSTNLLLAREEVFGEEGWGGAAVVKAGKDSFVSLYSSADRFSFLPLSWYEALGQDRYSWPGCENWWSGYPVICWIQLFHSDIGAEGYLRLFAEVGPLQNAEDRKKLIEEIKGVAARENIGKIQFQRTSEIQRRKYSKFFKDNSVIVNDVHDVEQIGMSISALLKNFQPCFDILSTILNDFTEYGQKMEYLEKEAG